MSSQLECFHLQRVLALPVLLTLQLGGDFLTDQIRAETWMCPQPGQMDQYRDYGGPGCRQLEEVKTHSLSEISSTPAAPPPQLPTSTTANSPSLKYYRPTPFRERSLSLPIVAVGQSATSSVSSSGIGVGAWLIVGYLANGTGPEILPDANLRPEAVRSLQMAVRVAAKAIGYDPKYISVRLLVPFVVDGPSAGSMYTVGIASALLGDPIRRDVCMSGTIEETLEIKPVGRLEDKLYACQQLGKKTMVVPDGADNSHLSFQGFVRTIHVIEVHTLADAYYAATGRVLRQLPVISR